MNQRQATGRLDRNDYVYTLVVALVRALAEAVRGPSPGVASRSGTATTIISARAERLAAGLGYSEDALVAGHVVWRPWIHYPVGYSFVLSLFYRLLGARALGRAGAQRPVRRRRGRGRASTRQAFHDTGGAPSWPPRSWRLHPGLIAYSPLVMTEVLATLLLLGAGLAVLTWRGSWRGYLVAGAILGVATLVRPESLLALPLLVLLGGKPYGRGLLRSAAAMAVAFVVILPWTYRNCERLDGCALVSTNGGWNLAIGAITPTGRFPHAEGLGRLRRRHRPGPARRLLARRSEQRRSSRTPRVGWP